MGAQAAMSRRAARKTRRNGRWKRTTAEQILQVAFRRHVTKRLEARSGGGASDEECGGLSSLRLATERCIAMLILSSELLPVSNGSCNFKIT